MARTGGDAPLLHVHGPARAVVGGLLLLLATAAVATPASAACTDAPAPGVVLRRCLLDGQDFGGANLSRADLREVSLRRANLEAA